MLGWLFLQEVNGKGGRQLTVYEGRKSKCKCVECACSILERRAQRKRRARSGAEVALVNYACLRQTDPDPDLSLLLGHKRDSFARSEEKAKQNDIKLFPGPSPQVSYIFTRDSVLNPSPASERSRSGPRSLGVWRLDETAPQSHPTSAPQRQTSRPAALRGEAAKLGTHEVLEAVEESL